MENGFEWPGLLSALVLAQHADQHCPERPILLAVDQQLGDCPYDLGTNGKGMS
jgi:hypothetical protein